MIPSIVSQLEDHIKSFDFTDFGMTPLKKPLSFHIYQTWLQNELHGNMKFLADHAPIKENPSSHFVQAKSAIVVLQNYHPHPYRLENPLPQKLRTALYAKGQDYHRAFVGQLKQLAHQLSETFTNETFECFSDSHPLMERDLAYQAGLGWFGKNSCLIQQSKGSLFFIGEILTSLDLQTLRPLHPDRCGTCTRCIDACPTQAIVPGKAIDSNKCISYLTIEAKQPPPIELRSHMNDWFFGCDICQTVCPWNEKAFGKAPMQELSANQLPPTEQLAQELKLILSTSNKKLDQYYSATPLSRPRGRGLKRNAIIVAVNQNLKQLLPDIVKLANEKDFEEFIDWARNKLGPTTEGPQKN